MLSNPPLTDGRRTLQRVELAVALLGFDRVVVGNLFAVPSHATGAISALGLGPEGWETARSHLDDHLAAATGPCWRSGSLRPPVQPATLPPPGALAAGADRRGWSPDLAGRRRATPPLPLATLDVAPTPTWPSPTRCGPAWCRPVEPPGRPAGQIDTRARGAGRQLRQVQKRKLIEVSLPLEAINRESAREKSIRHGHPSTLHLWWARRPLAAARAVLFAQLVDDPSARPEEFPTEEAQRAERERLHDLIERLVVWENIRDEKLLAEAHAEILKSTDGNPPPILDPFAGGGTIPLEAQRLGLEAHASDLNPVAVLINKALIEIPPKFRDQPPVFPGFRHAEQLARRRRARRRRPRLRPVDARRGRTHRAPLPNATPCPTAPRPPSSPGSGPAPSPAPTPPAASRCRSCAVLVARQEEGQGGLRHPHRGAGRPRPRWAAGQVHDRPRPRPRPHRRDRRHRHRPAPSAWPARRRPAHDLRPRRGQGQAAGRHPDGRGRRRSGNASTCPPPRSTATPPTVREPLDDLPDRRTPRSRPRASRRRLWHDEVHRPVHQPATGRAHHLQRPRRRANACSPTRSPPGSPKATRSRRHDAPPPTPTPSPPTSGMASAGRDQLPSSLCTGTSPQDGGVEDLFARQAIPMTWDFAEANPGSNRRVAGLKMSVGRQGSLDLRPGSDGQGQPSGCASAAADRDGHCLISTDPPYYDNIGYSDLSDFFYVWLRRSLRDVHPALFASMLVPKAEELVANPYRHDGRDGAKEFFEDGFREVFARAREVGAAGLPDHGLLRVQAVGDDETTGKRPRRAGRPCWRG